MLVASLINFDVKNQVPQVSFKIGARNLISFLTFGYDMNLSGSDMILFGSNFKFQEPSVMLVSGFINFGVTNQVPQVSFKLVAGDLMLVSFYEFADIIFCESLVIYEVISYYGAQAFALHCPRDSLPIYLITCSSPHRTSKDGDILAWTLAPNTWG